MRGDILIFSLTPPRRASQPSPCGRGRKVLNSSIKISFLALNASLLVLGFSRRDFLQGQILHLAFIFKGSTAQEFLDAKRLLVPGVLF